MSPEKFKSTGESQSNLNVFKDARFFMVLAMIAILASGCESKENQADEIDQDIAGVKDDKDADSETIKEWMRLSQEKDTDPVICEELPVADAGAEVKEESFEELVARIDKVLRFGVPYQLTEKITRIRKSKVCYAGDSYMVGITHEGKRRVKEENVKAEVGRLFVANGETGVDDDIEKHAMEAINNPNCKLLIINGGFNDLMEDCSDESYERVLAGYNRILEAIRNRVGEGDGSFEVIYYDIPITPKKGKEMKQVNAHATKLNNFMAEQDEVRVIKTSEHIKKWRKDKMHPKSRDYKKLFNQVRKFIR